MFKRVGSIVLTAVMIFTMVCSTFALPGEMSLSVHLDAGVTEVTAGETLKVYVDIADVSRELAALTVYGSYNKDIFELEETDVETNDFNGELLPTVTVNPSLDEDQVKVNWFSAVDVAIPDGNLMVLNFTVKADAPATSESFSFRFAEDGISYIGTSGNPELMTPGVDFSVAPVSSETVTIKPAVKPYLYAGVNGLTTVEVGDTVEVFVQVNNYQDQWAGFVVEGTFDKDLFEVTNIEADPFTSSAPIIARDNTKGTLSVGYISAENMVHTEDNVYLFSATFTAKAAGEASFNFSFKEDGVVSVGTGNVYDVLTGGTDYVVAANAVEVEVTEDEVTPSLSIATNSATDVYVDDIVSAEVKLNNYGGGWASVGIEVSYDPAVLAVDAVVCNSFGSNDPVVTYKNGKVLLTWFNVTNIDTVFDGTLAHINFMAIAAGDASISVDYVDGSVISIGDNGEYNTNVKGTDYIVTVDKIDVSVEDTVVATAPSLDGAYTAYIGEVGDTFSVPLTIQDYHNGWLAFTIEGTFDTSKVKLLGFTANELGYEHIVKIDNDNGTYSVCYISSENINLTSGELGLLNFEVVGAGDSQITPNFKDGGVVSLGGNGEYTFAQPEIDYIKSAAPVEITATATPVVTTPSLNVTVENDVTEVEEGAEVNVIVDLKDYANQWAGVAVEGSYDPALFELTTVTPGTFGANAAVVVRDDATGELRVTWMDSTNVVAASNANLLQLTFKAKTQGTGDFNFNFKEGGVVSIGANGEYNTLVKDTDYIEAADEVSIEVTERQPNAAPNLTTQVLGNVTSVEKGETVTVEVYVNEYNDDWAGFAIEGTFNKDLFELTTITAEPFGTSEAVPVKNNDEGKLSAAWLNSENVDGALQFKALTLVFTAKAAGEAEFNFNFKDGGIVTINGAGGYDALVPEIDYVKSADPVEITVTDSTPVTILKPTVSIKDNKTEVKQGETVTLIVGVENYNEVLTGITFGGTYDANIFDLQAGNIVCENFDGMTSVPVVDAANNVYHVTFAGTGIATGTANLKFFEVTLTAKEDADLGDTDLGIFFRADGMADANGETLNAGKYDATHKVVTVAIKDANGQECQHDWSGKPAHDDTTAGATSKHIYTCTLGCGETKSEACSFTEIGRVPADCDTAEKITYKCTACDYEYTADGDPATGHDWNVTPAHDGATSGATSKHIYTCGNGCGETKSEDCSFTEIGRIPATNTDAEKITYKCVACGYEYTVDGAPAHNCDFSGKPAHDDTTSGATSKHIYTCADPNCNLVKVEACSFVESGRVPADCDTAEKITYKCTACDYEYTVDGDPATGHDWNVTPAHDGTTSGATSKHIYTCGNGCGETKSEDCSFTEIGRVPADCDTAEKITYKCTACGYE